MGKRINLRVPEGIELPAKVTSALGELLPDNVKETYQQTPDYKKSIKRRINSLYEAFLFTLAAYPPNPKYTLFTPDTLKSYAEECRSACDLKKDSLEELHLELEKFTAEIVDLLATVWQWPVGSKPVKQAIACLNEAECYNLMMNHGRQDIATLTTIGDGNDEEFVLQYDESIPAHYELIINELNTIKAEKYPKNPGWLRKLVADQQNTKNSVSIRMYAEAVQAYFFNLKLEKIDKESVIQDVNKFAEKWDDIKRKSLNLYADLEHIHNGSTPIPSWFNELSTHFKEMIKILAKLPNNITQDIKNFKHFVNTKNSEFENTLELVTKIPQWYWNISNQQQYFLEHVLKNAPKVEDAVAFVPSRLRTIPVPSNFGSHSLFIISTKGEVTALYDKRYRSSHIASRDELNFPVAVQHRHCDSNLTKVMEKAKPGVPSLFQTLISPIFLVDYVPSIIKDYTPELPPDLELYNLARAAIDRNKQLNERWQHNHPYNIAKLYYYTQADNPDSKIIIDSAQKYVSQFPELQGLLAEYKNVLQSPMGSATFWDYDGRELFLSSLEQLIVLTVGGYSFGSCVSAKDRKAIELIHTDSMILFKRKFGTWPKFGDPKEKQDRIEFVNIFAKLYMSRHQHLLAGQNADGSEGIKNPLIYLPGDIAEAITKRLGSDKALTYDDRLATDNEVKNISNYNKLKSWLLPANELQCRLMARQLGEEHCTLLYDSLNALVNQKHLFQTPATWTSTFYKKDAGTTPRGIGEIQELMSNEHAGRNNIERVGKIFGIVLNRPLEDSTRTKATNSVYDGIRKFFDSPRHNAPETVVIANDAIEEWKQLFEESKTTRTVVVCS